MDNKSNILITSAGRRVSLVSYFQKEIGRLVAEDCKVFTTDLFPEMSPACIISDKSFKVGKFSDKDYIPSLLKLCLDNNVKLVIPTIDTELILLSEAKALFLENGINVIVSDKSFIECCNDKRKTNEFFKENNLKVPLEYNSFNPKFPLFIKPIDGSGSKDLYYAENESQLNPSLKERDDLIWMEYLGPKYYKEYTLDLYYNKNGRLMTAVPRVRLKVIGGETNQGITDKNQVLMSFLQKKLALLEGVNGCITLQLFLHKENNSIYGIEINPRFGGGYPLSYLSGANFPEYIIKEYLLGEVLEYTDAWDDKTLLVRYNSEMVVKNFNVPS